MPQRSLVVVGEGYFVRGVARNFELGFKMFRMFLYFFLFLLRYFRSVPPTGRDEEGSASETLRALFFFPFSGLPHVHFYQHPK